MRTTLLATLSLLGATLLGAFWFGAGPAMAAGGEVTVRAAGDSPASVTIKLDELGSADVSGRSYKLGSGTRSITGYSIEKVLEEAAGRSNAIDLDRIPYVEIDRVAAGSTIRLANEQIFDPDFFADGPPVFFEEDGTTVFVKPGIGGKAGSSVRFTNAPIGVTVGVADDLSVTLRKSEAKIDAGDGVTLEARVKSPPAGQDLEYRWSFGDGRSQTSSRSSVKHTYRKKGSYLVVVTVTSSGGAQGQGSGTLEVGQTEKKNRQSGKKQESGTGGGGSGGSGSTGGDSYGTGSGYGYGSDGLGSGYGVPGDFGYGSGPSAAGVPVTPVPSQSGQTPVPQSDQQQVQVDDGLVPVSGELVSGTSPAPVTTIPAPGGGGESVAPPAESGDGPAGIPSGIWIVAGAFFLLALGGLSESRAFGRY
jgi:PKD domain